MNKLPDPIHEFIYEKPVAPSFWPRRFFHFLAGSTIPLAILLFPMEWVRWGLIAFSILGVLMEAARALTPELNEKMLKVLPFFKPREREVITGATYLVLAATFIVFVFPREIAVLSLLFLSVGDPIAALIGIRDHRLRLFGKSLLGTAAFALSGMAAGALVALHPGVPLAWWIIPGAITAALAELVPVPIDDNITIPLPAAVVMALLAGL
jgi:dolichol kinase